MLSSVDSLDGHGVDVPGAVGIAIQEVLLVSIGNIFITSIGIFNCFRVSIAAAIDTGSGSNGGDIHVGNAVNRECRRLNGNTGEGLGGREGGQQPGQGQETRFPGQGSRLFGP